MKYTVSFTAIEASYYEAEVEANSPEEARELFKNNPGNYDWSWGENSETEEIKDIKVL